MARSILNIYDAIIEEKNTRSSLEGLAPPNETSTQLLEDLNSNSKVAVWRLWAYITAVAIHVHEVFWDAFKIDIETIASKAPAGTSAWYQKKILEFQLGDNLEYLDTQYVYNPIDTTKRIITRAAITERGNGLVIAKVAQGTQGSLIPLTTSEQDALSAYIFKIKFAGTRIVVFSGTADELTMNYDIYYDPIIQEDVLKENLTNAINKFLNEDLPFNGELSVTRFTDVLQQVDGVLDPIFLSGSSKQGSDTEDFTVSNIPAAGYYVLADDIENMFNFIQKV